MVIKSKKIKKLKNYFESYPECASVNFKELKSHILNSISNISKKDANLFAGLLIHMRNRRDLKSKK